MTKISIIQNAECETAGIFSGLLESRGIAARVGRAFGGEAVPERIGAAGLVVMGGPMGVYEEERYPFLRRELRLIDARPILHGARERPTRAAPPSRSSGARLQSRGGYAPLNSTV